jgi:hypothetical protein
MMFIAVIIAFSTLPIVGFLYCRYRPEVVVDLNNRFLRWTKFDSFGLWTVEEVKFTSALGVVVYVLFYLVAIYLALSGE